jgi:hypothetical protein
MMRSACFALALLAGVQASNWVITDDNGHALKDIEIDDLNAFLEFAQLDEDGYADVMEAEGMVVDDIKDITDEDLEAIGMKKRMHRTRFLRYAKDMRISAVPKKKKKKEKQERKTKTNEDGVEVHEEIIRSGPRAQDEDVIAARWAAANAERKANAKEDAAKRKEEAGEPDWGADVTQADKDLVEALEDEDPEGIAAAIEDGANINSYYTISGEVTAPLMYVSLMGFVECAEELLKHDPDFDLGMHGTGFTPIHGAAFQGQPEIVKALLAAGAEKMHRHDDGFVPMHRACWGNTPKHTEAVIEFLNAGVDVLTSAKDPNYPGSLTFEDQGGMMTPLNMSGSNPMTIGLLEEWEVTGKKPEGPMGHWGTEAFTKGQHAHEDDATVKEDL